MLRRSTSGTGAVLAIAFLLSACGAEDELAKCLSSNEPTILLKQIALTGDAKRNLDSCLNNPSFPLEFCRGLYLNANGLIRNCMKQAGYTFIDADYYLANGKRPWVSYDKTKEDVCSWQQYASAVCYRATWLAKIQIWLEPDSKK